jgi:DNA-binding transcriptional LysR family regulator
MDIHRLQTFCRVFELQSFSKAAQDLYLAQPTISSHIASLEKELGIPLFDRLGRAVLPTQGGTILYKHARKLIDLLQSTISEIHLLQGRVAGDLKIGGSTIPGHYLLPDTLHAFKERYPEVTLELRISDSQAIEEGVLNGELDIGVIGSPGLTPDVQGLPVMRDELVLIGTERFVGPKGQGLKAQDLPSVPWVLREKGSGTRRAMEDGLQSIGLTVQHLDVAIVVTSTQSMLSCVRAGMGVSVTSRLAFSESLERQSDVFPASIPEMRLDRTFHAVYHARRQMFPVARAFLDLLLDRSTVSTA